MKKPIGSIKADKRKGKPGAPRKLKKRNEWQIMRGMNKLVKDIETFSSMELQDHDGLSCTCVNQIVGR